MSERKIVVPEGMRKFVLDECADKCKYGGNSQSVATVSLVAVEAALRWMSENPIVPTDEQVAEMKKKLVPVHPHWANIVAEWQRRMFLAPEPELPCDIDDAKLDAFIKRWTDEWNEKATPADQFLRDLNKFRSGERVLMGQESKVNTYLGGGLYIDTQAEGACRVCGGMNGFHQPMCKERRR